MPIKLQALMPALRTSGRRFATKPLFEVNTEKPHGLVTIIATTLGVVAVGLIAVLMGMT